MEQRLGAQPKLGELRNGEDPGEVVAASALTSALREQKGPVRGRRRRFPEAE